ncbi:MAG: hypothetical protein ACXWLH_04375 [Candidatus Saccharimonadales bacterium]
MNLDELLKRERQIWGDNQQAIEHIVVCMGKTFGDISAQARAKIEKGEFDAIELKKELGNMIASTVRWVDDLGFDIQECINLALQSQQKYKEKS